MRRAASAASFNSSMNGLVTLTFDLLRRPPVRNVNVLRPSILELQVPTSLKLTAIFDHITIRFIFLFLNRTSAYSLLPPVHRGSYTIPGVGLSVSNFRHVKTTDRIF